MEPSRQPSSEQFAESTAQLVEGLRRRDPERAELLDRLYRDALVRFCWGYLGRLEEAEDAAQEVCYRILSAAEIPDHFRAWVYRMARNHCLNMRRERANRPGAGMPPASFVADSLTGHLTRLVNEERRSQVAELVGQLSEEQREVLQLRYVEQLSRAEIADVLGVAESLVKSRLFESLKRLREHASLLEDT